MLGRLLNYLRGRLLVGRGDDTPDPGPHYGASVSYAACPACGEGQLVYDADVDAVDTGVRTRCNACGAVPDAADSPTSRGEADDPASTSNPDA